MGNVTGLEWSIASVRQMFPVGANIGIDRHFHLIESEFERVFGHIVTPSDGPVSFSPSDDAKNVNLMRLKVYTYATVRAECVDFLPLDDGQRPLVSISSPGHWDAGSVQWVSTLKAPTMRYLNKKIDRIEDAKDAKGLRELYRSRGFIKQFKGLSNYTVVGKRIGGDLVRQPSNALRAPFAVAILLDYMEQGKDKIIQALIKSDFAAARKAVTGGTDGLPETIKAYSQGYKSANPFPDDPM